MRLWHSLHTLILDIVVHQPMTFFSLCLTVHFRSRRGREDVPFKEAQVDVVGMGKSQKLLTRAVT